MSINKSKTILIIDDIRINVMLLESILSEEYQVISATDGHMGLMLASEKKPDLILLDIVMPEMDGYEICKQLKSNPETQAIPVIFVSAKDKIDDEMKGLEFGAVDYIAKPLAEELVKLRVAIHLGIAEDKKIHAQLTEEKSQAEIVSRTTVDILSRISHEFRTPLNAILGFAQLLQMDDDLLIEQAESVEEIYKAGGHLLNLISGVLELNDFHFPEEIPLNLSTVSLQDLIKTVLAGYEPLASERHIEINNLIALSEDITLRVDASRLNRSLENLISNAVLYNREYGKIILSYEIQGDNLKICIQDSGEGLTEAEIEQVFHPFDRLHKHATIEGAGLGLLITRSLMDSLEGKLGVESTPNEGSTFWLEFPYDREDS